MTQPLPVTTYAHQAQVYRHTCARLLEAVQRHQEAKAAADHARDELDDKRAALLVGGLPGVKERCPTELKEAHLARALAAQTQAQRRARDELRQAEAELEAARIAERTERETLRMLQIEAQSRVAV